MSSNFEHFQERNAVASEEESNKRKPSVDLTKFQEFRDYQAKENRKYDSMRKENSKLKAELSKLTRVNNASEKKANLYKNALEQVRPDFIGALADKARIYELEESIEESAEGMTEEEWRQNERDKLEELGINPYTDEFETALSKVIETNDFKHISRYVFEQQTTNVKAPVTNTAKRFDDESGIIYPPERGDNELSSGQLAIHEKYQQQWKDLESRGRLSNDARLELRQAEREEIERLND